MKGWLLILLFTFRMCVTCCSWPSHIWSRRALACSPPPSCLSCGTMFVCIARYSQSYYFILLQIVYVPPEPLHLENSCQYHLPCTYTRCRPSMQVSPSIHFCSEATHCCLLERKRSCCQWSTYWVLLLIINEIYIFTYIFRNGFLIDANLKGKVCVRWLWTNKWLVVACAWIQGVVATLHHDGCSCFI